MLEKILEEIETEYLKCRCKNKEICNYPESIGCCYDRAISKIEEIIHKHMKSLRGEEYIRRQDAIDAVCKSYRYESDRVTALQDVPSIRINDGWIPVEEWLPEDGEKVLVWYEYFRYGDHNCMFQTYGIGWQYDGYWSGDVSGARAKCIAWQPLPEPYKGGEEYE